MGKASGGGGARERDVGVASDPSHEDQQRSQPLAAGGDGRTRVLIDVDDLAQPRLDAGHRGSQRFPPEFENRVERIDERRDQATSPTCMAMMPPAIST